MGVVGIDHVQLAMPPGAEEEATAFFVDVLGMARVPKPAALAARGGCWFVAGGAHLHLGGEEGFRPARKAHPALAVEDLPALVDRLEAAGHEVREGAVVDGRTQRFVDDPFGNRIELVAVD